MHTEHEISILKSTLKLFCDNNSSFNEIATLNKHIFCSSIRNFEAP